MRTRTIVALLLTLASAGLSVPAAQAASDAAPAVARSWNDCPVNRFCAWSDTNGNGARAGFINGADDLSRVGLNSGARSVYNRTGDVWCVFSGAEYSGTKYTILPGAGVNVSFTVRSLYRHDGLRCSV